MIFLCGSRRSGGFSLGRPEKLAQTKISLDQQVFAQGNIMAGGQVHIPPVCDIFPGYCLLVVRNSGFELGFFTRGLIVEIARQHPELLAFDTE